jgi:dTDP-glucose 4,6-dehydratase
MKILVTGGAGFIGTNFCNTKIENHEIVIVDALTYASINSKNFIENNNQNFYKTDIRSRHDLDKIFELHKIDVVINFAAETHVDNSIKNPEPFLTTNIIGVANLLECSLKNNVKKFIQISTDEVYGSYSEGFANENSSFNPSSPYSASKAAAELLIKSYVTTYGLDTNIIRLSNNYGPYQHEEKLIPYALKCIAKGKKIGIYGNGSNIREWIYVEDAISGIISVLLNGKQNQIYNISSGHFRDNIQVIRSILQYFNLDDSHYEFVPDRKGHDFRYALDNSKIRTEIGWEVSQSFEEGLEKTIKWYLENKNWWLE